MEIMKMKKSVINYLLLIAGVIILINILSDRFFLRLDFTSDKRYTLGPETRDILSSLKEPVTVTAWFSKELPPEFAQLRRDFKEELIEYSNRSNGKVQFEFINPNEDEATEQKALQAGISPVLINVREKDQVKQQKAYLGAVVQYGDQKEVIPLIQPGAAMEYSLSTSIKKLSVSGKPEIAFLEGNGEASLNSMVQVLQSLSVLYDVEPVDLSSAAASLDKYKTLVIVDPKDTIPEQVFRKLDDFLASGKSIYIAMNRVNGNLQTASGTEVVTGLEKWLEEKGIRVNPNFIVDPNCGSDPLQRDLPCVPAVFCHHDLCSFRPEGDRGMADHKTGQPGFSSVPCLCCGLRGGLFRVPFLSSIPVSGDDPASRFSWIH